MLIEKYMNIDVNIGGDEYDPGETIHEEVYVPDSEIRHYIDTFLSAEDVLTYAKEIAPQEFTGENSADLDFAYDLLVDEFDEHDDIEDIAELNDYIQDCIQRDYMEIATEQFSDRMDAIETDKAEYSDYMKNAL